MSTPDDEFLTLDEYIAMIRRAAADMSPGALAQVEGAYTQWRSTLGETFDFDEFTERDLKVVFLTMTTLRAMAKHTDWEDAMNKVLLMIASTPKHRP